MNRFFLVHGAQPGVVRDVLTLWGFEVADVICLRRIESLSQGMRVRLNYIHNHVHENESTQNATDFISVTTNESCFEIERYINTQTVNRYLHFSSFSVTISHIGMSSLVINLRNFAGAL